MSLLLDAIFEAASAVPDQIAIDDGRAKLKYRDLPARVTAVADLLLASLGHDRRPVGIMLDNGIDWVLADLALLAEGRPCIPLPAFFTSAQVDGALADAGAVALVAQSGIVHRTSAARDLPDGTAKITYTSGSTGTPTGICLSDTLMLATAKAVIERFGTGMAGRHLPILPLGVLLENVAGLYSILLAGGTYAPREASTLGLANPFRPDFVALVQTVVAVEATSLILVPELLAGITAVMEASGIRLPLLRLVAVGGARVSVELLRRCSALGLPVVQGYGLTECGSVVSIEAIGEVDRGTTGTPLEHLTVSLAPDGEIMVSGAAHLGTIGGPPPPSRISTGDIGTIDPKGRLSITGRKGSLLVTGHGRNVAPEWIEEVLRAQPAIAQAFVYGDGDAALSAALVPAAMDGDMALAVETANASLPSYAQITRWKLTSPFTPADGTLTPNGRLRRAQIIGRLHK